MPLDLKKIHELAYGLQTIKGAQFLIEGSEGRTLAMEKIQYIPNKDVAALLAAELNKAIEPILVKLEKQLRAEMAKASKE